MPVNDTTTNRSYQKPNIANTLSDDVGRLRSALDAIDTDMASKAPTAGPTFTGVTTIAAGSAAAPSLTFTGATSDTGIYSPGADQVAISTGGTGRLFVDASGRVGVGTSSPNYALDVQTTGTSISSSFTSDQSEQYIALKDSGTTLGHVRLGSTSGSMLFFAGNGERARLTSDGKLGLGTSSPGVALDVNGDARANNLYGYGDTNTGIEFPGSDVIVFKEGGAEAMRIDASSRLLVGTSSARSNFFNSTISSAVHVESATDSGRFLSLVNSGASGGSGGGIILGSSAGTNGLAVGELGIISFQGNDGTEFVEGARIEAIVDGTTGANDMPGRIVFSTTADGASSPTERLRITSAGVLQVADAGNIAVGTTTGTKIGTATTQKLGFYNKTPVVQPAAVADATDAASVITQLNALLARMRDLGLIAT